ncbi:MAG: glycosyltransferase, partial [Prevotellaceae bacterium]|nr:glycosyltransferase [Prevotellaceae bacterium]
MWLSFVIPLYNCEKYILTCLDSILNQGLDNDEYEVIVVNDGSTDDGVSIVNDYCKRYKNFRLVNKENGGVASARNRGIEEARGEYIHFMDADDRLLPEGMKTLRDTVLRDNPHVDMVTFWAHTVDRYYDSNKWEHILPFKTLYKGSFGEYGNKYGFGWSSCLRIILRDFLIRHNIRFKNYNIGEDVQFMMDVFTVTTATIIATNLNIYRYCVRDGSALTSVDNLHIKKILHGYIGLFKNIRIMELSSPYRKDIFE